MRKGVIPERAKKMLGRGPATLSVCRRKTNMGGESGLLMKRRALSILESRFCLVFFVVDVIL